MTTASPAPASTSAADKIANFFVVPVIPTDGSIETVFYYALNADGSTWTKVPANGLDVQGGGKNGQVVLSQPSVAIIEAHTDLHGDVLDTSVTLYAGVAKTLHGPNDASSLYGLSSDKTLTIPVKSGATRGLILVFSKASGDSPNIVEKLISTSDPEIKNSAGGNTGIG